MGCNLSTADAQTVLGARSLGMGGTGVASAKYQDAIFHNPALMSRYQEDDDFGMVIPSVFGLMNDKDDLVSEVEDIADKIDDLLDLKILEADIDNYNTDISKLKKDLNDISGATLSAQVSAGFAIAIPQVPYVSAGFFVATHVDAFGLADIDKNDLNTDNIKDYIPIDAANPYSLNSQAGGFLFSMTEYGIALAKDFSTSYGTLRVGVTPKLQEVRPSYYVKKVEDFNDTDLDYNDLLDDPIYVGNVDLGLAFETDFDVNFGLTAQNLIPHTFDLRAVSDSETDVSGEYELNPMVTFGVEYLPFEWLTITSDIELTKRERFKNIEGTINNLSDSFDDTQFFGIGAEVDIYEWCQFRVGYRYDMQETIDGMVTAGFGLSPWDTVHIDLAGGYGGEDVYALSLQLSLTF